MVIALTLYTFWAARRGHDFNFLGPFLFGAVLVLMVFVLIQVLWSSNTVASHVVLCYCNYFGLILVSFSFSCRFCFHWVNCPWWSMVAWQPLYFAATSSMTQTTWSRDTRTMNTSGLRSPCIWTSSTSSCLCSLFLEPLIVRSLCHIQIFRSLPAHYLFFVGDESGFRKQILVN